MALINKSLSTASLTNKEIGSAGITFDDTTPKTFDDMIGPFNNPYVFSNKSLATGSITNRALS